MLEKEDRGVVEKLGTYNQRGDYQIVVHGCYYCSCLCLLLPENNSGKFFRAKNFLLVRCNRGGREIPTILEEGAFFILFFPWALGFGFCLAGISEIFKFPKCRRFQI